jgi:hypothetical protein
MSFSQDRIPLPSTTGKERWNKSVKLERILLELRALAVNATLRCNADKPSPAEFEMWAKDLRRGRMNVAGSVIRFLKLIEQREMGAEGRRIALQVNDLLQQYIDILLPADAEIATADNTVDVDITSETRKARLSRGVQFARTSRGA